MDDLFFYTFDDETNTTVPVEVSDESLLSEQELEFFYDDTVRKVWHSGEEEWYFSIVDVCQVLTDSSNPSKYWFTLKTRLSQEGFELSTNCRKFKMKAQDGKMRPTDCANAELVLNALAEISTTEISKATNPQGMSGAMEATKQGGTIAKNAREALEKQIGRNVISPANASTPTLLDDDATN